MKRPTDKNRICPVEKAGALDSGLRRLLHNPKNILKPYITEGMHVLDIGCGPGFFTIEMAKLVQASGKVVAADLQEVMLEIVREKIKNTDLQHIIKCTKCQKDSIGVSGKFDFILIFYMLHEIPDQTTFLKEVRTLLKPDGKILIAEPNFHVSKSEFAHSIELMKKHGFTVIAGPRVFFSRAVVIMKSDKK